MRGLLIGQCRPSMTAPGMLWIDAPLTVTPKAGAEVSMTLK